MLDMVQGGDQIQDTIFFDEVSTWQRYDPNVEITYDNPQTGVTWTVPWSFAYAYISWTKHELGLNKDTTTAKYRAQRYKAVMWQKHQNLKTDICNSMEAELWAAPDFDTMENTSPTGPRVPYSIPCFITEDSGGIPLNSSASAWGTTVMNINVANEPKWDNQRETYTFADTSALAAAELFAPMSRLMHNLKFDRLPKSPEYSDKSTSPHFIGTTLTGLANYEFALRVNQDTFRGVGKNSGQDPDYNNPTFRGVPLDRIETLETAALYDNGSSALAVEASADLAGPRYYFVNGEYLKLIVHSENYLVSTEPMTPVGQPFNRVQVYDCWNNMICRSRRRHGILSPSADTTNA